MISILTVNYHSSNQVLRLAASIRRRLGKQTAELVVINHSTADPVRLRSDDRLPIVVQDAPNLGFATGINRAFRASHGEHVMVCNPDIRLSRGALDGAVRMLDEHPEVGIVLPKLVGLDGDVQRSVRRFYTWPVILYARTPLRRLAPAPGFFRDYLYEHIDDEQASDVDWGIGAAMFLRRHDVLSDSPQGSAEPGRGLFDERFFIYFEDVDLCLRTWRRGLRVTYCPHIRCIHAHRRTSGNPFSLSGWYHLRSLFQFVVKHRGLPRRPRGDSPNGSPRVTRPTR